jgi:5-methyltetrahydropteroyltriglutamate--homocysteine methyltransferase
MRHSTDRILTSHVGALPGDADLWTGEAADGKVRAAVREVIQFQKDAGVDIVNEGELTKGGNWVMFVNSRLTGFEPRQTGAMGTLLTQSRDWAEFDDFYAQSMRHGVLFEDTGAAPSQSRVTDWVCAGPITYVGQAALAREIEILKSSLGDTPPSDAFLTTTAPTSIEAGRVNEHYESEEAYVFALAEALSVEYEAIAAAGLICRSTTPGSRRCGTVSASAWGFRPTSATA